jgi:hypothetical protein
MALVRCVVCFNEEGHGTAEVVAAYRTAMRTLVKNLLKLAMGAKQRTELEIWSKETTNPNFPSSHSLLIK